MKMDDKIFPPTGNLNVKQLRVVMERWMNDKVDECVNGWMNEVSPCWHGSPIAQPRYQSITNQIPNLKAAGMGGWRRLDVTRRLRLRDNPRLHLRKFNSGGIVTSPETPFHTARIGLLLAPPPSITGRVR